MPTRTTTSAVDSAAANMPALTDSAVAARVDGDDASSVAAVAAN